MLGPVRGDVVVVELPGPEVGGTLRLPALIWEVYTGGAVEFLPTSPGPNI